VTKRSKALLVGLAYLAFVSIGLPDGLLGVAWPSVRAYFGLPLDALGQLLVAYTLGYLASSFGSGRVLTRASVGGLLAASCLATAAALFGYAITPSWWPMVALGVLAGLGAGAIDAGLNTFAATHFSARSVNWLHAFYGVGATTGPALMTTVLGMGRPWQLGYAIVGTWQLALAGAFALSRRSWPPAAVESGDARAARAAPPSNGATLRLPATWASIALFFVYTGLEAAAGTWTYSLFTEGRGIPASTAGMWVSVYYGALTVGRFLSGFVVAHVPIRSMLRVCMSSIALGAALIWLDVVPGASFAGLALVGLAAAPVFPSLIATTPERLGEEHTANGVGYQIAGAVLGQSLVPALVGIAADGFGLEIVGPSLLGLAIVLLVGSGGKRVGSGE
jgi:fucose permease